MKLGRKTMIPKIKRRCKCGCGGITSPGKKWVNGHNNKVNHPMYRHGLCYHKLYTVWCNVKQRCYNPNHPQYKDYGGRGIRVYIKWRDNFKAFYSWSMCHGWEKGLEIDRKDNDGNYHPKNCRFVIPKVNNDNQRPKKTPKTNTSGYKGVYYENNKYRARPTIMGKLKSIGYFKTAEEAAQAIKEYHE